MSDPHASNPSGADPDPRSPSGDTTPYSSLPRAPQYAPPQYAPPQYAPPQYIPAPQPHYPPFEPGPKTNGAGVAAMVCGIVAAVVGLWTLVPFLGIVAAVFAFLPAVAAVILGHIGMSAFKRYDTGRGMSLSGLLLGYGTIVLIIGVILFWVWVFSSGERWSDPYYW